MKDVPNVGEAVWYYDGAREVAARITSVDEATVDGVVRVTVMIPGFNSDLRTYRDDLLYVTGAPEPPCAMPIPKK